MRKLKLPHILFLLFLVFGTLYVVRLNSTMPYRTYEGYIFGTSFRIIYQSDEDLDKDLLKAMQGVDASLSMFNDTSTLALINGNKDVAVDYHLDKLFPKAQRISEATGGDFDITVAPLVNVWGFGFKNEQMPTDAQVDSLMQFIGYKTVRLEGDRLRKDHPETMIDLSAVAKGYGCDVVAEVLDRAKVRNYMVWIGGEVVLKGQNDKNKDWTIGLDKPVEDSLGIEGKEGYQCVMALTDCAVATSGNYRNFYYKDGQRYAHTINPHTGHPVEHSLLSATVIAPKCYEADAYATAFMVGGVEKAKEILSKDKDLRAYLIYSTPSGETEVWMSDGIKDLILK